MTSAADRWAIATIPQLMDRLAPHRQPGRRVVLDLGSVPFMDSYSLGQILKTHASSAAEGWTLHIRVETSIVRYLLDLTGAASLLSVELPAAA